MTPEDWAVHIIDHTANLPPELDAIRRERVADAVRAVMEECALECEALQREDDAESSEGYTDGAARAADRIRKRAKP